MTFVWAFSGGIMDEDGSLLWGRTRAEEPLCVDRKDDHGLACSAVPENGRCGDGSGVRCSMQITLSMRSSRRFDARRRSDTLRVAVFRQLWDGSTGAQQRQTPARLRVGR